MARHAPLSDAASARGSKKRTDWNQELDALTLRWRSKCMRLRLVSSVLFFASFSLLGATSPVFKFRSDCQALCLGQVGLCRSSDCQAILMHSFGLCRSRDCEGITTSQAFRCQTRDCEAVVYGNYGMCESTNCRAVVLRNAGLCR